MGEGGDISTTSSGHPRTPAASARDAREQVDPRMRGRMVSVVIPVFNSAGVVGETIARTAAFFERHGLPYEIIAVNDGSHDASWEVLLRLATSNPHVVALNLLRNYGQHNANLAGFRHARGEYVVTIDDDLQNPPEEIIHLINTAAHGHDVVFGRFDRKNVSRHRSLGSRAIGLINRRIFGQPRDLVVSNVRMLRRDVVDRICADRSAYPYITGLALLYSSDRANVTVRHEPRTIGKSTYNPLRIARLVLTILFSYSAFPLRLSAVIGCAVSLISFLIGVVYLALGLFGDVAVQGWTTLAVMLAFFNGVTIAMLSMLGEYLVRTLQQSSAREPYHVIAAVRADD
ncbi:MAG: glycosyltransferase [Egibacteraceae bacterium]